MLNTTLTNTQPAQLAIKLSWQPQYSFWSKILHHLQILQFHAFDLDLVAFLLKKDNKVENLGNEELVGGDVVFFNSPNHASGAISLNQDSKTGSFQGADEMITISLNQLPAYYQKVVFLICLHKGARHQQHLGQLRNAAILIEKNNEEVVTEISLHNQLFLQGKCMFHFLTLCREGNEWRYELTTDTYTSDNFTTVLQQYIYW